jgi:hypothetical protein
VVVVAENAYGPGEPLSAVEEPTQRTLLTHTYRRVVQTDEFQP